MKSGRHKQKQGVRSPEKSKEDRKRSDQQHLMVRGQVREGLRYIYKLKQQLGHQQIQDEKVKCSNENGCQFLED